MPENQPQASDRQDNILMSVGPLEELVQLHCRDATVGRTFLSVWPIVQANLESFSGVTGLPIFAVIQNVVVFQSSPQYLPAFCQVMLSHPQTALLCFDDAAQRSNSQTQPHHCHAGLSNEIRRIDTRCIGEMSILFGALTGEASVDNASHAGLLERLKVIAPDTFNELVDSGATSTSATVLTKAHLEYMDTVVRTITRLIEVSVGYHAHSINMAHELTLMLLGLGLLTQDQAETVAMSTPEDSYRDQILAESQLGLYVVRNFLSHVSAERYSQVVRKTRDVVDLNSLLAHIVSVHRFHAKHQRVAINPLPEVNLPHVLGFEMELRRLFHNLLNNAIKYSYHSIPESKRRITIAYRIPYDPGFRSRRFSISIQNYGLGTTPRESLHVFEPGFRGEQAIAEVPMGSGIGLSECRRIMKEHKGHIRYSCKEVHSADGVPVYLTTVTTIFPYVDGRNP